MAKQQLVTVSLATAMMVSWPVKADHISFIGGEIPYVFHQEQTEPHNRFYEPVLQQSLVSHKIKLLPYRRAMRDFSTRSADCLFVATDTKEDYPQDAVAKNEIIFSNPINRINLHAYTRLDEPAIKSMSDLEGKVIAGARSHLKKLASSAKVSPNRIVIDTADHIKAFDLLDRGRVDVVNSYEFGHVKSATNHEFTTHNFDKDFIIETLNAKIKELRQDKKLEELFDPGELVENIHPKH